MPHPNQPEGEMVFPHFEIEQVKKQEGRDLTRFDLDYDIPDQFLPDFPAPIYITTRPDLGDVSQGKLVANQNYRTSLCPRLCWRNIAITLIDGGLSVIALISPIDELTSELPVTHAQPRESPMITCEFLLPACS
jgi:hypothetical protein